MQVPARIRIGLDAITSTDVSATLARADGALVWPHSRWTAASLG
jgi:hypothetical protein